MYAFFQSRPYLYMVGLFCNWRECLVGAWHFLRLMFLGVPSKSVLLVEFNPFHGETQPGFVYYFQKLGYEVTVLTRYGTYSDSPFLRMTVKPRHFCLTLWGMRHYLRSRKAQEYEYIFYNSAHLYLTEYRYYGRTSDFLGGRLPEGKQGCGMIEHEFGPGGYREGFRKLPEASLLKRQLFNNTFVLTPLEFEGRRLPMLNPCFFGRVKAEHGLTTSGRRVFLTIGNVSRKSRNFPALLSALKELGDCGDYEVWVVGVLRDPELLEGVGANVRILGRLTFEEMYHCLEQADFFLPLLDPVHNAGYLDGCTSGSRQLILGFGMPPVVHSAFARHFGLGEAGAICYGDEAADFANALKRAMKMTPEEYAEMKRTILEEARRVRRESLTNLSRHLANAYPSKKGHTQSQEDA